MMTPHPDDRDLTVGRRSSSLAAGLALIGAMAVCLSAGNASAAARTRFWNLTTGTIKDFRLAPAGSTAFGKNQCENDKDGAVDHDERLPIVGVPTGRYDAKIVYSSDKTCTAKDIGVEEGKIFSLDDKDLKDCK
jgi:hypothetical protein